MSTSNNDAGELNVRGQDPLFPRDAVPEHQKIRSVTFCVLRADGNFVRLRTFKPDEVRCWDDVKRVLCTGLYRAVGLDEENRPVAWYPPEDRGWVAILPGVEPCMVSDSALVALEPPAAASLPLDPAQRAWIEADTKRIQADTERLRVETEYTRRECAWMDMVLAGMQSPAAVKPGGKPN